MPIPEGYRNRRDRWPLEFELEGVPRENRERARLLEQKLLLEQTQPEETETMAPTNSFAVDYKNSTVDINNPPPKRYNPNAPENQYPRYLYNHETGHVLRVKDLAEEQRAAARGFKREPAPNRDYHLAQHGRVAPLTQAATREEPLTLDEEALEAGEAEAMAEHDAPQQAEAETGETEADENPRSRKNRR